MTPEELLIRRYKMIAPVPFEPAKSMYNVGDIFTDDGKNTVRNQNGDAVYPVEWDKYPHLFKPFAWWEDRKPEDMPRFVKRLRNDKSIEVMRVLDPRCNMRKFGHEPNTIEHRFIYPDGTGYIPATLEEYNAYINKQ